MLCTKAQLWVPRVVSNRDQYPARPPPVKTRPYRLFLDNAGQIAGLRMKTYDPAAAGPARRGDRRRASALNFRDVMVTLGLLPALAYERSAARPRGRHGGKRHGAPRRRGGGRA